MDFYNLLYRGYTGEYQLVSSLYRNGLDAARALFSSSPAKPSAHARAAMQQAPAPKTPLATFGVPTSKPPSVGLRPLRNERAQTTIPRSANACAIRPSPTYPRPTANQSPLVPFPS